MIGALAVSTMFASSAFFVFNPLCTGGLFHCYMLDESICHFWGIRFILLLLFYSSFDGKSC